MADYKIQLGVQLDTSDIQAQINKASGNIKPIELKIDAETKELTKTIKEALNSLSKGTKNAFTLDTSKIEVSLDKLSNTIIDIKTSLGTLDSKSGMKSLLSSINQIATALGKVENESDSLVKSLSALSKKNFKINLGLQMGGSNSVARNINFGSKVRNETLPELQKQVKAYEDYFAKYYEGKYRKGSSPLSGLLTGSNVWEKNKTNIISINQKMADPSNLEEQIKAYKKYISIIKEAASLKGIDVSSVASQFSTSAEKLVQDTIDIKTGAKEAEQNLNKLKGIFGSSVDGEKLSSQLDSIVTDLNEIKIALSGLLQNNAINGLTQSFKEMSVILKDITDNLTIFRNAFSNVGNGLGSSIDSTTQELKNNANILDTFKRSLQNIGMDADKIDIVANRIKNLGVQIETLNQSKSGIDPKEGMLSVDIAGIDKLGNAVKLTQQYDIATGNLIGQIDKVSTVHQKAGKSAETFAKQQKNAVSNLTNQINQLNRSATDQNANRPIKESSHLDSLKSKYQEIIAAIQKMGNASSATFDDERNEVKRLISEYKSLKSEFKNAENVSMDFMGSDFASGLEIAKNRLREFKADAKGFPQVTHTVEELDKAIEGVGDKSSLAKFNDQLRVAKSELKAVKAEVLSNNDNFANKIRIDIETEKFENKVSQLHSQLDQLSDVDGSLNNLRASIKQVDDAYDAMLNATDDKSLIQAQKQFAAAVEKTNNELKIQAREQRAVNNAAKLADSRAALKTDMLNWLKKNSKATKEYKAEIDRLIASLDKLDQAGVNGVRRKFKNIDKDAELKGLKGLNFFDSIKSKIKEYSVYFGAAELFMYAEQGLRSMFEQVKAIDSAMTELKKVTNETDETYERFLTNAADRARAIGTTIDGLVSSTAGFARLGYGFEDAQGLAEVANIYAVVGDEIEGVEGATKSLISTMAAFKDEMNGMSNTEFAMSIIDKFNEIGNNFAISSGGIGEALERSASSLMAANNTIDESIALITAANTVVQDPEQVGTAFKTISMRIRGAKTELEEAGLETDGMVESTAKLRSEILSLTGVDIMDGANQFKSTYAIMDELAVKWKDLTDIQQATVTELIAGKRQGNIVSSLMTNFDTARAALETSLNSEGSALAEHAKYMDSIEYKLNSLKASWQSFSQTFMDSDGLKNGITLLTKFVDLLTMLVDNMGLIGTISLGVLGKGLYDFVANGKAAKATLNDVVNAIHELNSAKETSIATDQASAAASSQAAEAEMNEVITNEVSAQTEKQETSANIKSASSEIAEAKANKVVIATEVAETKANTASTSAEIAETEANIQSVASETAEATANMNSATSESAGIFKAGAKSGNAYVFAIMAIVAVLSTAITQFKKFKEEAAKVRQETIEASDKFLDAAFSFEKAYIKYSGKTDLTVEEEQELESAINGTVEALGDKSNALQNVVNGSNDYIAALEAITNAELEAAERAAKDKKAAAKQELINVATGWTLIDGNELDLNALGAEAASIAREMNSKFVKSEKQSAGYGNRKTEWYATEIVLPKDADVNDIVEYYDFLVEYKNKLSDAELVNSSAYTQVTNTIDKLTAAIESYTSGVYDAAKAQYQLSNGIPKTTEEYLKMREAILRSDDIKSLSLDTKNIIASTLDSEYKSIFDLSSAEVQAKKFIGVIKGWGTGTIDGTNEIGTIETFLNMRTSVNNNDVPIGEYISQFQAIDDLAKDAGWSEEEKNLVYTSFGIDTDTIKTQYDEMLEYLGRKANEAFYATGQAGAANWQPIKDFLGDLTADELAAVISIRTEIDWENTSTEDIRKEIEDRVKLNEALNFSADIEVDTTALEALNEILAESASAIGLSEESIDSLKAKYADLEDYNPHTLFEKTANGVKVNRDELVKLEKKYNDLKKTEVQEHLDTLADAYNDVTAEIDDCTDAGERAELLAKREMYADQIEELATYQAQLEGVTGAYQKWLDAQEGSEDYEGYESIATNKEDIQGEIDRGFISNKGKAYIDLLSGENLEGKSIDDYYNAWKKLDEKVGSTTYSIHDFFTVNDDGDITSTGVDRFFKGLQQDFKGSVAEFNDKTGQWEYDFSQENLQKIQDEWEIGIEAIELLLEAAAAAGYDVDWGGIFDDLDLDTSNFESLVSVAEAAQKELNKLEGYEDLDFNFSTTTVEAATSELEKAQKTYNELVTNDDGTINLDAKGADNARIILATLLVQKQQLEDSEIAINISTSGLDDSQAKAVAWVQDFREKYKNLEIAISTGEGIEEAKTELETVKTSLGELDGDTAQIAAQLVLGKDTDTSGDGFKTQVNNAIDSIGKQDINVGFKLDETAISDLNSNLLTNFTVDATAKITNVDKSQLEAVETSGMVNWNENTDNVSKSFEATGTVNWNDDVKNVKTSFSANGTVNWTSGNNVKVKVISEANGTANANGTTQSGRAFVRGNWGIKGSGTALVGELGMETLVRGGRFYTIGDNGAEFIKYKQGDIIFNHKQTEELFKNGKVTSDGGRGRMFADGSAYAEGTALWQATASGSKFAASRTSRSSKSTKKEAKKKNNVSVNTTVEKSDDAASVNTNVNYSANVGESNFAQQNQNKGETDKDKFEETFDWIEVAIERIEREINNLDQIVGNVYKSWGERNTALSDEIDKVREEITLQKNAANEYLVKANGVGLDSAYIKNIQDGTFNIEDFEGESDEALVEKIKEYQKWYELYLDCIDKAEELKETEAELYGQRFENIQSQYDSILQGFEHTESMLEEYTSQAEAKGHIVSKNYYQALIDNEKNNIAELQKEQSDLIAKRDEAVASGAIVKGSEAWYDMCSEIDSVTQAIEEGTTALIEYDNAMRDIDWEVFDLIQERISNVTDEANFLIDLMSYKKLFDDNGKLTDKGMATIGLHGQNYNTYMYQADEYAKEVAKLDGQIAKDPYDQELINRRQELLELQRESILAAEDEKQAIADLVEEGINLELEALQERIDLHNEELDSMKDLYDYQKNVEEQTKNIASLQKQLRAYEGFDDEETRATVQKLKVELESAQQDLEETEYDKYISDQKTLLDELYLEYETTLNTRLDDVNGLITQVIDAVNIAAGAEGVIATALGSEGAIAKALVDNGVTIKTTLESEAKNVGATLSTAMKGIWSVDEGNAKSVLTTYGQGFQDKQTATNTILNDIKAYINRMVDDVDKDATTKVNANKTSTSAKKDPTKTTSTTTTTKSSTTNKTGDGVAKIGDKVKFLSGKYYYDSQGVNPAGSKNHGKQVYITSINTKKWATHPYHISTGKKLGSGDLGWLKLSQLSGYATGKKNFLDNEIAWTQENGKEFIVRPSDGAILTPIAKGDSVLNAQASGNIWNMANNPAEFIKDSLKLDATNVPNGSSVNNSCVQNFENITFSMPNVRNYEQLVSEMQKDKSFEKLILAMTVDRIAGGSSLAKNKSIRK